MKLLKYIVRSFLLFLPIFFNAQTYPFINYGVKDGLSQSNVSGVVQDKNGYFWIATESGISKFDGKNIVNYTTQDGLADNNVSCIFMDDDVIWFGHGNGSITKYNGKEFFPIVADDLPKDEKIYDISKDKNGSLWISTATLGAICILDPNGDLFSKSNYKSYSAKEGLSQYVFSIIQDKNNNMWFFTDVGIKILDSKKNVFEFFTHPGMPFGQVTAMRRANDGNILIGMFSGDVVKYYVDKKIVEPILTLSRMQAFSRGPAGLIYTVYEDKEGNIWSSILSYGVCRYEKSKNRYTLFNTANGLSVNKIKCIYQDREGNMIFGTQGQGIDVFKGEKFVSFMQNGGLINNQVFSICQDKNLNYWFGTNEGLSVYNSNEKIFKNFFSIGNLINNSVRALASDKQGNIWIGTWGGKVTKYDILNSRFVETDKLNEVIKPFVSCLLVDQKNKLWVGTGDGLATMDLNSGSLATYRKINGLSDNDISCLFEDSKGRIWIGTKQKGVNVFDGTTFKTIGKKEGLMNTSVTSIAEDAKGRIWIGTEGGGVFVYANNNFVNYKIADGLPSDFITLITLDKNKNIWLGTNKGLCRYNEGQEIFKSYSKNDGFTAIETKSKAVYNDNEGNIWFGTGNGVFKYDPKLDVPNSLEPLTHITSIKVNSKEVPLNSELDLSYKDNSLSFDFIGISLSDPDGVTYKVMLEGYDDTWRPATKRTFEVFSNLPHGKYTFKLIACNSNGLCNAEPVSIKITITPPFWKTWWFYVLVIIIGLAIMFSYIKIRERSLIKEKEVLEQKVKERTAEVVEKNIELDEKNKDITASIRYAKRIQDAILPPDEFVKKFLPKTFILFKPKDIVSGDFYWLADKKDMVLFAAVDCTGHGVPGAFMSIVGHNLLDQIVGEYGLTQPAAILDALNKSVSDTLRQSYEDNSIRDGMDIALCSFDRKTNILEYAGAYNPLWLIRNGELTEYKASKFPIGNLKQGENKKFANNSIQLQPGDTLYIFSDGYADQFGGPAGKKYKYSTFKQLLLDTQHMSMEEQGEHINKIFESWRGTLEQVDDVLVIGTRL